MDVYLICYLASFLFARAEHYYLSGFVLLMAAAYLYWYDYRRSGNIIHLRAVFSFFWVSGQALSCLKLSRLQREWSPVTWVCFLIALTAFWLTFEVLERRYGSPDDFRAHFHNKKGYSKPLFEVMGALTVLSLAAFSFEAYKLGFIPLLVRGVPHAYSTFHISGVHYLTVSCVLIPALSVLYFQEDKRRSGWKRTAVVVMDAVSFLIPILCVSRFQMILAVFLALFTFILGSRGFSMTYVWTALAIIVPCYLLLTVARSHDVEYLNGIFEMKNSHMPIFVTQPYMYISNNYDNFDCLVKYLDHFAWGMKSLFPLWALTGLKFLYPALINYPIIVNKEELTTLTLFYDSYYDFGVAGVVIFACMLGALAYFLVSKIQRMRNPAGLLFYAQIAIYFMFSFFTTWFSNPATWFYFAVTGAAAVYCAVRER
ncbi:O-antigen polymerase [Clostridium sp. AM58-1XD]|uniref:O-antigen polymerase n=1 Tax=Clostridium sp. AM58-1XD TaxID=2292307 RepID=UPI000E492D3A|nr:O-antigen polymerase [Clostridium sp. AM58-1XD]RGY96094.1 oligosaccharide repeat unit polymerase [Clostridium sp. AM58-1XD]